MALFVSMLMIWNQAAAFNVKVYAFNGGVLKTQTQFMIKDTRVGTAFNVPVPFYLIKHGEDWVAYDTGLNAAVAKDPFAHLGERAKLFYPVMKPEDEFKIQIQKFGLKPENLKAVIISHGHWDHAGAIGNFKGTKVPVYFQEREMADIRKAVEAKKAFQPYNLGDFTGLDDLNVKLINGVFDLFEDGTVVAFPTPGHTMGHQSLIVRVSKGKPLILTADALYTLENMEKMIPPNSAADFSAMMQNFHMFKVMNIIGAEVVPSHDPDYWAKGPWAPDELTGFRK